MLPAIIERDDDFAPRIAAEDTPWYPPVDRAD